MDEFWTVVGVELSFKVGTGPRSEDSEVKGCPFYSTTQGRSGSTPRSGSPGVKTVGVRIEFSLTYD